MGASKIYQQIKNRLKPYYLPLLHKAKFVRDNRAFQNHGNAVLLKAKAALEEIDVFFWLDFGTLLGVYRDGKLIGHDTDVDVAVFLEDYAPIIEETMVKHGFTYDRKIVIDDGTYGMEQGFSYQNVKIDIFYYSKQNNQCYCHLFPLDNQKNYVVRELYTTFTGFKKISFLDTEWNIPKDPELRLTETYGENFRIPIKDWYTPDAALNSTLINKTCHEYRYS